ncbi:MAG: hypothetical protein QGI08_15240 [Paracoccaceae bacterium]|jgi:hypothetical protein|nr:hypothetical protein [Paracoccaceae bacterium]
MGASLSARWIFENICAVISVTGRTWFGDLEKCRIVLAANPDDTPVWIGSWQMFSFRATR